MADKRDYDGMRYPSIDLLLDKIDSKYKLAYVSAKRAREIDEDEWTSCEDGLCVKPIGQALEEIIADKTKITFK